MSLAYAVVDQQCSGLTSPRTQGPNFFDRLSDEIFKVAVHTECTINGARRKFCEEHKILGPLLSIAAGFGSSILLRTLLEASNGIPLGNLFNIGGHRNVLQQQDIPAFSSCEGNGVTPSEDTTYSGLVEWLSQQTGHEPNSVGWNSNATQESVWLNQLNADLYKEISPGDCIDLSTITINCADGVKNCPPDGPALVNQLFGPNAVVVPEQPPLVTESPVESLEPTPASTDVPGPTLIATQAEGLPQNHGITLHPALKECKGDENGITTWWPNRIDSKAILQSLQDNMQDSQYNRDFLKGVKESIAGDVNLQQIEPGECLQMDVNGIILKDGETTLKKALDASSEQTIQGVINAVLTICAAGLGLVGLGSLVIPHDKPNPNVVKNMAPVGEKFLAGEVIPASLGNLFTEAIEGAANIILIIPRLVIKALFRKK